MSKDEIHKFATSTTPQDVPIPQTWGALIVWAIGKFGIGVVFLAMLVPVYQDLKASNQQTANLTAANVRAIEAMTHQLRANQEETRRLGEVVQRLETVKRQ